MQLISTELTWLRQYVVQLLSQTVSSNNPTQDDFEEESNAETDPGIDPTDNIPPSELQAADEDDDNDGDGDVDSSIQQRLATELQVLLTDEMMAYSPNVAADQIICETPENGRIEDITTQEIDIENTELAEENVEKNNSQKSKSRRKRH
jgi:hypothetical protein